MTPDFFVRLTLATHRVAEILPKQDSLRAQLQNSANQLLVSLLLLVEENPVTPEQKRSVAPRAIRELGTLVAYLNYAKRAAQMNPVNFEILEKEYDRVGEFLRKFHEETSVLSPTKELLSRTKDQQALASPVRSPRENTTVSKGDLSGRQFKILELMRNKPKVQVWELQKVLPEVTKRTLRRDLDDLLSRDLIVRQGEWNEVFYQIR